MGIVSLIFYRSFFFEVYFKFDESSLCVLILYFFSLCLFLVEIVIILLEMLYNIFNII